MNYNQYKNTHDRDILELNKDFPLAKIEDYYFNTSIMEWALLLSDEFLYFKTRCEMMKFLQSTNKL